MHPIEKFHKMVTAGNVLSPGGSWISRSEALKRKKTFLNRLFSGEVEKDGKWVSLKQLRPDNEQPTPAPSGDEVIHLNPAAIPGKPVPETKHTFSSDTPAEKKEPSLFPQQSSFSESASPSIQTLPEQHATPPSTPAISSHTKESPAVAPDTSGKQQPTPGKTAPSEPFQHDSITIRSIPLGKETTLTVSESRAGSALVAVCSVQGFIDQSNADDFNMQLISMLDFGVHFFIIDLEQTTLVGSAGWGVFAVTARLIKASNGHLIICAMKEEIEESFNLLQFNEVIDSRRTISDCLNVIQSIINEQHSQPVDTNENPPGFSQYGEAYDDLPLPEKIKTIIARNGPLSLFRITALLKTERFGKTRINPIKLYLLLKEMNLHTRMRQVRYYRSC